MQHLFSLALTALALPLFAADSDGFVAMFNGRDLTGWTNINCAPETWTVKGGVIHCTGKPVGALRTTRHYENFIMEVEWRHLSAGGNSGVFMWGSPISAPGVPFLRGIEVQVLDHGYATNYEKQNGKKSDWFTTHGDVFPIHGAKMIPLGKHRGDRSFPSEDRSKPSPEWNHYRVVCTNGSLRLHVNGKEVSGGDECNYRKGYLALESEGAPVEFRNIRIKELPSSNPAPELVAPLDPGWAPLYTGVDLRGWKSAGDAKTRWQTSDWRLVLKEGADAAKQTLWTEAEFGDVEFVVDVRAGKSATGDASPALLLRGRDGKGTELKPGLEAGKGVRVRVQVKGTEAVAFLNDKETARVAVPAGKGALGLKDTGAGMDFGNLHVRKL
jgi:Domain of Unknown Function (DUF1080)